jgi:hypothetical protein
MNNLNDSIEGYDSDIYASGGLALTVPVSRYIALVGEANYLYLSNVEGVDKSDEKNGRPKGSSDYIKLHNINFPLLLQLQLGRAKWYVETGAQYNINFASNRSKQSISKSDYGFVAGLGWGLIGLGGFHFRLTYNDNMYYTAMMMLRLFWAGPAPDNLIEHL